MSRNIFLNELVDNISTYINLITGDSVDEIKGFVQTNIKERIKHPQIHNIVRHSGDLVVHDQPLINYIKHICDNNITITPSGSSYMKPSEKQGLIPAFEDSLKKDRKIAKKEMFDALEIGNKILAENKNFLQANKKISANALSGIMKSAFNLFYDVGGYNAITSVARTIVTLSFVTIEQFAGGNFAFFSMDELINHVILCIRAMPDSVIIKDTVNKYKLRVPEKTDLVEFLLKSIDPYERNIPSDVLKSKIESIVFKLTEDQIIYIYYYNNLKHLFFDNEKVFKPWIQNMMKVDGINSDNTATKSIKDINKELLSILTVCNDDIIEGRTIDELIEAAPEIANKIAAIGEYYNKRLNSLNDLFDTFIYTNFIPPKLNNKKHMFRNNVLLLDTDSNLFTTINWVRWFTDDEFSDRIENYQISSLMIYFIFKVIENILHKFARSVGVEDEKLVKQLIMKNEFFFPVFLILNIKKNYAGLTTIQEGRVLKKPKLDLKGVVLRSSSICKDAADWFKDFVIDFFKMGQKSKINTHELLMKVVDFENKIRTSIEKGELTYLKYSSVRTAAGYAKPESSAFMYAEAWNVIFGEFYDEIMLPTKVALVKVNKPTNIYLDSLTTSNEKLYKNFITFLEKYPKFVSTIAVHPLAESIPQELIPLIDIRQIIYHNVSPAYTILKSIGINTGYKNNTQLLLSDLY